MVDVGNVDDRWMWWGKTSSSRISSILPPTSSQPSTPRRPTHQITEAPGWIWGTEVIHTSSSESRDSIQSSSLNSTSYFMEVLLSSPHSKAGNSDDEVFHLLSPVGSEFFQISSPESNEFIQLSTLSSRSHTIDVVSSSQGSNAFPSDAADVVDEIFQLSSTVRSEMTQISSPGGNEVVQSSNPTTGLNIVDVVSRAPVSEVFHATVLVSRYSNDSISSSGSSGEELESVAPDEIFNSAVVSYGLVGLLAGLLLTSVLANLVILLTVLCRNYLRRTFFILYFNLATSDLLASVLSLPVWMVAVVPPGRSSAGGCWPVTASVVLVSYVSVGTIIAICAVRMWQFYNFRQTREQEKFTVRFVMMLLWVSGLGITVGLVFHEVVDEDTVCSRQLVLASLHATLPLTCASVTAGCLVVLMVTQLTVNKIKNTTIYPSDRPNRKPSLYIHMLRFLRCSARTPDPPQDFTNSDITTLGGYSLDPACTTLGPQDRDDAGGYRLKHFSSSLSTINNIQEVMREGGKHKETEYSVGKRESSSVSKSQNKREELILTSNSGQKTEVKETLHKTVPSMSSNETLCPSIFSPSSTGLPISSQHLQALSSQTQQSLLTAQHLIPPVSYSHSHSTSSPQRQQQSRPPSQQSYHPPQLTEPASPSSSGWAEKLCRQTIIPISETDSDLETDQLHDVVGPSDLQEEVPSTEKARGYGGEAKGLSWQPVPPNAVERFVRKDQEPLRYNTTLVDHLSAPPDGHEVNTDAWISGHFQASGADSTGKFFPPDEFYDSNATKKASQIKKVCGAFCPTPNPWPLLTAPPTPPTLTSHSENHNNIIIKQCNKSVREINCKTKALSGSQNNTPTQSASQREIANQTYIHRKTAKQTASESGALTRSVGGVKAGVRVLLQDSPGAGYLADHSNLSSPYTTPHQKLSRKQRMERINALTIARTASRPDTLVVDTDEEDNGRLEVLSPATPSAGRNHQHQLGEAQAIFKNPLEDVGWQVRQECVRTSRCLLILFVVAYLPLLLLQVVLAVVPGSITLNLTMTYLALLCSLHPAILVYHNPFLKATVLEYCKCPLPMTAPPRRRWKCPLPRNCASKKVKPTDQLTTETL